MRISSAISVGVVLLAFATAAVAQVADEYAKDDEVKVKTFEELAYPRIAFTGRIEGAVVVRLRLNASGSVTDAEALSGSTVFVPQVLANAKRWTFVTDVKKPVVLVYLFDIDGTCAGKSSFFRLGRTFGIVKITACGEWIPWN